MMTGPIPAEIKRRWRTLLDSPDKWLLPLHLQHLMTEMVDTYPKPTDKQWDEYEQLYEKWQKEKHGD